MFAIRAPFRFRKADLASWIDRSEMFNSSAASGCEITFGKFGKSAEGSKSVRSPWRMFAILAAIIARPIEQDAPRIGPNRLRVLRDAPEELGGFRL